MGFDLGHGIGLTRRGHPVTVSNLTVASVVLSPASLTAPRPTAVQLVFVAKNAQGQILPGKTFTFGSTVPATATVSASGVLTPVAVGTTSVTATCNGITSNAVVVTVT